MILIISSPEDKSTNDVIDWLLYYKIKFVRISENDPIKYKCVTIENNQITFTFDIKNQAYNLSQIDALWYRRSHFKMLIEVFEDGIKKTKD